MTIPLYFCRQDCKFQMINKLSFIDNARHRQKKLIEIVGQIYLITSSNNMWNKWKELFEKQKTMKLIDPDTRMAFNEMVSFK